MYLKEDNCLCRAPFLKRLHLSNGHVGNEVLHMALKKLTLLEDLEISISYNEKLFESVTQARPDLKLLRVRLPEYDPKLYHPFDYDGGLNDISVMCELRSLELLECRLTISGLMDILDNCPLLETLHVTGYFVDKIFMDERLLAKCSRVKNLMLPPHRDD